MLFSLGCFSCFHSVFLRLSISDFSWKILLHKFWLFRMLSSSQIAGLFTINILDFFGIRYSSTKDGIWESLLYATRDVQTPPTCLDMQRLSLVSRWERDMTSLINSSERKANWFFGAQMSFILNLIHSALINKWNTCSLVPSRCRIFWPPISLNGIHQCLVFFFCVETLIEEKHLSVLRLVGPDKRRSILGSFQGYSLT